MIDLIHHYKEREPCETIQIIENFFKSLNIEIRIGAHYHSEINTYSCSYCLYYKNKEILSCNGKGMTKEYSKASCYAELYERFCAYLLSFSNNYLIKSDIMQLQKEKYGFYLYPNEKELTKNEYLNNIYIRKIFKNFLPIKDLNNECFNNFMEAFSDGKKIGMPYQSLTENYITYQDFHMIMRRIGSTGLATGNSIEEALVQGCSEIFERIVVEKTFKEPQNKYYLINYPCEQIDKLKKLGYTVYLYDLSYNFNLPVCMLIVQNKQYQTVYTKFGSSPIIDIAIERCFTELYQGFEFMIGNILDNIELTSYNIKDVDDYIQKNNNSLLHPIYTNLVYLDYIILNSEQINTYNKANYLDTIEYTNNKILLDFIKKIIQKNNYHFNWLNISLSSNIFAVQIVPEEYSLTCRSGIINEFGILSDENKKFIIKLQKKIFNIFKQIKNKQIEFNNEELEQKIHELLTDMHNNDLNIYEVLYFLNLIFGNDIYEPCYCKDNLSTRYNYNSFIDILLLAKDKNIKVSFPIRDSRKLLWEQYQMFLNLKERNCSNTYIQQVFKSLNIEYINFDQYEDTIYVFLIYLLYVKNLYDLYNSDEYKEFINILLKCKNKE